MKGIIKRISSISPYGRQAALIDKNKNLRLIGIF